jgi:hypothetical protein
MSIVKLWAWGLSRPFIIFRRPGIQDVNNSFPNTEMRKNVVRQPAGHLPSSSAIRPGYKVFTSRDYSLRAPSCRFCFSSGPPLPSGVGLGFIGRKSTRCLFINGEVYPKLFIKLTYQEIFRYYAVGNKYSLEKMCGSGSRIVGMVHNYRFWTEKTEDVA